MKTLIAIFSISVCVLSAEPINKKNSFSNENPVLIKTKSFNDNIRARPDQKSLLIAFDTTGSMSRDLVELQKGAINIVHTFSTKANDPIYNYVLSLFNDPTVEEPFITRDPEMMFEKLRGISIEGGGDCPELALQGLANALQVGLTNSPAFLFSDASAKDYELYDSVANLIQRKQSTVNFFLTGDCDTPDSPEFKVYGKIARASGGQVLKMDRENVGDVMVAMSVTLESDFVALRSFDSDEGGSITKEVFLDDTIKRLSVSFSGLNSLVSVKDSSNNLVNTEDIFSSTNIHIVTFDVTDSNYTIEASAESAFSLRVGGISILGFEFGFSRQEISSQSETYVRPISEQENILSIFVSDLSLIENLESIVIFPASSLDEFDEFELPLKLNNGFYSTELFEIPPKMFRIRILGKDLKGNVIDRVISTGIESISTMIPEVEIDYDLLRAEINGTITLDCQVKSLTSVNISWVFGDDVLEQKTSNQSSSLQLKIENFELSNVGTYACVAENDVGEVTREVTVTLNSACLSECPLTGSAIIPNFRFCNFYYDCVNGVQESRQCPAGTVFDIKSMSCGDPETSVCASKDSC